MLIENNFKRFEDLLSIVLTLHHRGLEPKGQRTLTETLDIGKNTYFELIYTEDTQEGEQPWSVEPRTCVREFDV
jgi:hypothetical protein